jgi:glutamate formiminotransferase/formiminotetrahydrofolate cyclodeaminase
MMKKIVECVPNFSEGRRPEIIEAITAEVHAVNDAFLLGKEMDADHNRAVITLAGEPEAVKEAAFRMIKKASELIDLTGHTGEHPRMGATDVVPFIPVENMTMEECVQLARDLGQRVGEELQIPVYFYEEAATRPERKNLASVRKGQFEGLREEIGVSPERVPDCGPKRIHPTAGATAIGARFFLIAYNVNLNSQDVALAKAIGKKIRESSGGFPCVKAMGFELKKKNCVQVSMNMTNYSVTSLATVFSAIQQEAEAAGVAVLESELIGFLPREALVESAVEFLKLQKFDPAQILENRITQEMAEASPIPVADDTFDLTEFLEGLASGTPTPGGGSASALAGALAAALAQMVCHLTLSKKKYQEVATEIGDVQTQARQLQQRLEQLISEDSQAYNAVLSAFQLPKTSEKEKARRSAAIQDALKLAATTPLNVMKNALKVIELAAPLVQKGNPNAITDAGCAIHLANAAIAGAALNVRINLGAITDREFTEHLATELTHIQEAAQEYAQGMLSIVASKL